MSQPVKLSDALVLEARIAGQASERSIAGQVEFWAKLGKSVEMMMDGRQVLALRQSASTQPLSESLASVSNIAGRNRLANYLDAQPYPHFKQHPAKPGLLIRIDEDGTETAGRFVNRIFVVETSQRGRKGAAHKEETPKTQTKARRACA